MKKIINAIKNYMNNYNAIQAEMLRSNGTNYVNAEMFASALGMFVF